MADPITSRSRQGVSVPAADATRVRALPRWHYLAAFAAGAANTLSFAPTPHGGWLQLAIFVFFFAWLSRTTGWKSAALTGGAFGFGNLSVSVNRQGTVSTANPLCASAILARQQNGLNRRSGSAPARSYSVMVMLGSGRRSNEPALWLPRRSA